MKNMFSSPKTKICREGKICEESLIMLFFYKN